MLSHEPIKQEFIIPEGLEMNEDLINEFQTALTAPHSRERIEAVKTIGRIIYAIETPVTLDSILQLLTANDLSHCPYELLVLFYEGIKCLSESKLEPLVAQLKAASHNPATIGILLLLQNEKKLSLTEEELKAYYERLSEWSDASVNSEENPERVNTKALAMMLLGVMYVYGLYVKKDKFQGARLYEKSSHPIAMNHLAVLYELGDLDEKLKPNNGSKTALLAARYQKAAELYEAGSALGFPIAKNNLAGLYRKRHLDEKLKAEIGTEALPAARHQKVTELLEKASALGHPRVMIDLAVLYMQGLLARLDGMLKPNTARYQKVAELLEKASALGLPRAMVYLAGRYSSNLTGQELTENERLLKAKDLLERALGLGDNMLKTFKQKAQSDLNWLNKELGNVSCVMPACSSTATTSATPTLFTTNRQPAVRPPRRTRTSAGSTTTSVRVASTNSHASDDSESVVKILADLGGATTAPTAVTSTSVSASSSSPSPSGVSVSGRTTVETRTASEDMATLMTQFGVLSQKMDTMHQELGTMANDITQLKRGMAEIKHRIDSFDNIQQENSKRLRVRR